MKNFFNSMFGNSVKIFAGISLAIVIIFLWENWSVLTSSTEISFIGSAVFPLWIWLLGSFAAGIFIWFLLNFKSKRILKKTINTQKKELQNLKEEINKLRNLSLTDDIKSIESISPSQTLPDKNDNQT